MPLERACRKAGPFALLIRSHLPRYNQFVNSKRAPDKKPVARDVEAVDSLFRVAGLVRSGRTGHFTRTRAERRERSSPEELTYPIAAPSIASNGVQLLHIEVWKKIPWLWHGFSSRRGGVSRAYCCEGAPGELNLGLTIADDRALVLQNRQLFAEAISGSPETPLITLKQFHSKAIVKAYGASEGAAKADGLVTEAPGVLIAVQTADCIPVLVADRRQRVVAAFHAGWRGTVNRIVESGVGKMRLEFGSRPEDLIAAIGPGVGPCCYAVGEEVLTDLRIAVFVCDRAVSRGVRHRFGAEEISHAVSHAAGAGALADRAEPAPRPHRGEPSSVAGRRSETERDQCGGRMHPLHAQPLLLASRVQGPCRTHDERHRHSAFVNWLREAEMKLSGSTDRLLFRCSRLSRSGFSWIDQVA